MVFYAPPGDVQRDTRLEFPKQVSKNNLRFRNPCEPIPHFGKRFIIGIATYSTDELNLVDKLAEVPDVEIFDVLDCQQMSDFDKFIPGIADVYRTPIIGVIIDGKLVDHAEGLQEVMSILNRFNILA